MQFILRRNTIHDPLCLGPMGERLDNMLGGNPNPTYGQAYGGAPGVGGFNNMGGGYGNPYGGAYGGGYGGYRGY